MNGRRSLAMGARNARPNGPVTPSEIRQLYTGLSGELGDDEIQTRYQYLLGLAEKPDEELTPRQRHMLTSATETTTPAAARARIQRANDPVEQEPSDADGLALVTLGKLRSEPKREVSWLVEGVLPADGLSLLVAPPKVGKSTLARCLSAAVASGDRNWLGRPVQQGVVIHLALEERLQTILGHYDSIGAPDERIHLLDSQSPAPGKILEPLRRSVEDLRPSLVVIDPLFQFVAIRDGNEYAEVAAALHPLIALARETCTHILLVHHSRKSGGDHGSEVLGSTALSGSVDTMISLATDRGQREFYAMGRDDVHVEKTQLTMDENGWVDVGHTKTEAYQDKKRDDILRYLKDRPEPFTEKEIHKAVTGNRQVLLAALRKLVVVGRVTRSGGGKKNDPFRYSFVVPGTQQ